MKHPAFVVFLQTANKHWRRAFECFRRSIATESWLSRHIVGNRDMQGHRSPPRTVFQGNGFEGCRLVWQEIFAVRNIFWIYFYCNVSFRSWRASEHVCDANLELLQVLWEASYAHRWQLFEAESSASSVELFKMKLNLVGPSCLDLLQWKLNSVDIHWARELCNLLLTLAFAVLQGHRNPPRTAFQGDSFERFRLGDR